MDHAGNQDKPPLVLSRHDDQFPNIYVERALYHRLRNLADKGHHVTVYHRYVTRGHYYGPNYRVRVMVDGIPQRWWFEARSERWRKA